MSGKTFLRRQQLNKDLKEKREWIMQVREESPRRNSKHDGSEAQARLRCGGMGEARVTGAA